MSSSFPSQHFVPAVPSASLFPHILSWLEPSHHLGLSSNIAPTERPSLVTHVKQHSCGMCFMILTNHLTTYASIIYFAKIKWYKYFVSCYIDVRKWCNKKLIFSNILLRTTSLIKLSSLSIPQIGLAIFYSQQNEVLLSMKTTDQF